MKRWCVLFLMIVATANAGVRFTAITTQSGDGVDTTKTEVKVEVEGDNARIEFRDSANPMAKVGTYIVTKDAGKTMYLVNPEDKTYMTWTMGQMTSVLNAMGGIFKMEFKNPKVDKLEESDGGKVLGHNTQRYKFKTTYDLELKAMGMRQNQSVESIQESWTSTKYKDNGMRAWLRNGPVTGIEGLDKLIEESMKATPGFPLRTKTKTTTRQYNRKRTKVKRTMNTVSDMQVTEIEKATIDASRFEMPAGYNQVDMMGGEEGGLSSLKGIFKRKDK